MDETIVSFVDDAPYGLITTQTCELVEEGEGPPLSAWVQLVPVFNALAPHTTQTAKHLLPGDVRKRIRAGTDQYRLLVPDLAADGLWFADFTFEVPVERGWLASRERIVGYSNETDREEVGKRIAWLRSRPAFDTRFVAAVQQPIWRALRELRRTNQDMYERMHAAVLEVGITLNSRLRVAQAELAVIHDRAAEDLLEWWRDLWVALKANADDQGFNLFPLRVADVATLSAAEYRRMTRLPLAVISPNPAWYGTDPEGFPTE
jgi:hypothetical protein